jgi:hypothetical protein
MKLTPQEIAAATQSIRENGARGAHYLCDECGHVVVFMPRVTSSPGDERIEQCDKGHGPVEVCTNPSCKICLLLQDSWRGTSSDEDESAD